MAAASRTCGVQFAAICVYDDAVMIVVADMAVATASAQGLAVAWMLAMTTTMSAAADGVMIATDALKVVKDLVHDEVVVAMTMDQCSRRGVVVAGG